MAKTEETVAAATAEEAAEAEEVVTTATEAAEETDAETEEESTEESTEEESTEEESTEDESTEEESTGEETTEETVKMIYIGPSIPRALLAQNNVISGTEAEIEAYLARMSAKYPEIKYLVVPVEKAAAAKRKVRTRGNILHKYYEDMAARARVSR